MYRNYTVIEIRKLVLTAILASCTYQHYQSWRAHLVGTAMPTARTCRVTWGGGCATWCAQSAVDVHVAFGLNGRDGQRTTDCAPVRGNCDMRSHRQETSCACMAYSARRCARVRVDFLQRSGSLAHLSAQGTTMARRLAMRHSMAMLQSPSKHHDRPLSCARSLD